MDKAGQPAPLLFEVGPDVATAISTTSCLWPSPKPIDIQKPTIVQFDGKAGAPHPNTLARQVADGFLPKFANCKEAATRGKEPKEAEAMGSKFRVQRTLLAEACPALEEMLTR